MVDSPLLPVVLIVRVDREVGQADGEVLDWGQAVGAAGRETVGAGHVPVAQSDQVDGGGGGLGRGVVTGLGWASLIGPDTGLSAYSIFFMP